MSTKTRYDLNRTVYFGGEPYKIVAEVNRNEDPQERISGVTLLGSIVTLQHTITKELIKVYPWDYSDPDGLDKYLIELENAEINNSPME